MLEKEPAARHGAPAPWTPAAGGRARRPSEGAAMSSQAAMLKPVLWERLFERESAPISACGAACARCWSRPSSAATCRRRAPVPSSRHLARSPARIAQHGGVRVPAAGQRGLSGVARAAGHFVRHGHAGHLQNPAPGHGAPAATTAADDSGAPRAGTSGCVSPSLQRNIVTARLAEAALPLRLRPVRPGSFPTAEWRECCIKALSVLDIRSWAPDHHPRRPRADRADPAPRCCRAGRLRTS